MREGKVATCVKINLSCPRNIEIAAACGFDCVWIDMEHVATDYTFVENAVRAAKNFNGDVLTRVKRGSYSDLVNPLELIGKVDAVICATDIGAEHVERCKPFLDAGIPMFIDKPLVDNEEDFKTFIKWRKEGKKFISSSSMRYCKEFEPF